MVKKTTSRAKKTQKHITHNKTHILLRKGVVVYSLIVFFAFVLLSLSALSIVNARSTYIAHERFTQITSIYSKLNLGDSYRVAGSNVFGDKRVYDWDSSRTESSSVEYGRDADRTETFADLKSKIEAAGFTQIEGPDYGQVARQDHYVDAAGHYIRVSIETKAWHDALVYGTAFPDPNSAELLERGPVYVTIRVNLDDNNE